METNCWDVKTYRNNLEKSQFSGKIRIFLHSLHSLSTLILYSSASDTLSSLSLTFLEKLNVQKHSRGRQMSKGGNFVSEAVLYFKVIYTKYYKNSNECCTFLFLGRLGCQASRVNFCNFVRATSVSFQNLFQLHRVFDQFLHIIWI